MTDRGICRIGVVIHGFDREASAFLSAGAEDYAPVEVDFSRSWRETRGCHEADQVKWCDWRVGGLGASGSAV